MGVLREFEAASQRRIVGHDDHASIIAHSWVWEKDTHVFDLSSAVHDGFEDDDALLGRALGEVPHRSSVVLPLTVMRPAPRFSHTRATASLRRPVA